MGQQSAVWKVPLRDVECVTGRASPPKRFNICVTAFNRPEAIWVTSQRGR